MFYDGTISSKTALMTHPYNGSTSNGIRVQDQETFIGLVKKARSLALPVAVHVIGDLGLHELVQILKNDPPQSGQLDRLIHTPYIREETLQQLKGMPLSIDVQPQFLSSDLPWALDRFSTIPEFCFPWKSLMDHGIVISGSSDAPVEIPNPLLGMHAALFRTSDHDGNVYFPSEKLSRFDAIKLYTTTSQIQTIKHDRGYLKQGYVADMTMMKDDLFTMDASELKKEQTVMTVIDEQIVYMATHKS